MGFGKVEVTPDCQDSNHFLINLYPFFFLLDDSKTETNVELHERVQLVAIVEDKISRQLVQWGAMNDARGGDNSLF